MVPRVSFDMNRVTQPGVLMEYVYDEETQNEKIGVLVAIKLPNGKVRIGWGFADRTKGDQFNRDFGLTVAFSRILGNKSKPFHPKYAETVQRFCERVYKYFHEIPEFPGDSRKPAVPVRIAV